MNPVRQYNRNPLIEGIKPDRGSCKTSVSNCSRREQKATTPISWNYILEVPTQSTGAQWWLVLVTEHLLHRRWREDRYPIQATLIQKHAAEAMKIQCC